MPYVIITRDKPGSIDLRKKTRAEHLKYIERFVPSVLVGGGFITEEDALAGGGLIILDVENRSALKPIGLLTRDAREVERKKPGQKKARKK